MMGQCGDGYGMMGGSPWFGLAGMGFSFLAFITVIVLVIWAVRSFTMRPQASSQAIDILNRRLAAGEITHTDYEQVKRTLLG